MSNRDIISLAAEKHNLDCTIFMSNSNFVQYKLVRQNDHSKVMSIMLYEDGVIYAEWFQGRRIQPVHDVDKLNLEYYLALASGKQKHELTRVQVAYDKMLAEKEMTVQNTLNRNGLRAFSLERKNEQVLINYHSINIGVIDITYSVEEIEKETVERISGFITTQLNKLNRLRNFVDAYYRKT